MSKSELTVIIPVSNLAKYITRYNAHPHTSTCAPRLPFSFSHRARGPFSFRHLIVRVLKFSRSTGFCKFCGSIFNKIFWALGNFLWDSSCRASKKRVMYRSSDRSTALLWGMTIILDFATIMRVAVNNCGKVRNLIKKHISFILVIEKVSISHINGRVRLVYKSDSSTIVEKFVFCLKNMPVKTFVLNI